MNEMPTTTVTVFCDPCGLMAECEVQADPGAAVEHLYLVARDHVTMVEGWTCSPEGDRCPSCVAAGTSVAGQEKGTLALIVYIARSAGLLGDGDDARERT